VQFYKVAGLVVEAAPVGENTVNTINTINTIRARRRLLYARPDALSTLTR
jgi:hypothetical protein